MRLVVQDANIIIDLIECDLFEPFFRLDLIVSTTSLIIGEITQKDQLMACRKAVQKNDLQVVEVSTLEYLRLQSMPLAGLSVPDKSVLTLAGDQGAILLSGDGKLRRAAEETGLRVHGILWVFDQLVGKSLLPKADASLKLKTLSTTNPRLPQREIEKRLRAWNAEGRE